MKSYEQIAAKMYEAYRSEYATFAVGALPWVKLDAAEQTAWIAAAKVAYQEITEVH